MLQLKYSVVKLIPQVNNFQTWVSDNADELLLNTSDQIASTMPVWGWELFYRHLANEAWKSCRDSGKFVDIPFQSISKKLNIGNLILRDLFISRLNPKTAHSISDIKIWCLDSLPVHFQKFNCWESHFRGFIQPKAESQNCTQQFWHQFLVSRFLSSPFLKS